MTKGSCVVKARSDSSATLHHLPSTVVPDLHACGFPWCARYLLMDEQSTILEDEKEKKGTTCDRQMQVTQ